TVVDSGPAHRLREVIDQWESHSGQGVTVIDSAPGGSPSAWRVASWCDQVVVVARDCPAGIAAATSVVSQVLTVKDDVTLVLRLVKGGTGLAVAKRLTGANAVIALREEPSLAADSTHGLAPGDRQRGALSRCATRLLNQHLGLGEPPAQKVRLAQRVTGMRPRAARPGLEETQLRSGLAELEPWVTRLESGLAGHGTGWIEESRPELRGIRPRRWLRRSGLPQFDQRALAEDW
ncbi:MAG: hypothetical protein FWG16_04815, partial [Micrococcales bacterium]|nr:hypothetical protein [Micrococcales bacterium]